MTFDVLLIDPPWQYRNVKTGGSHTSGAAQKYDTLSPRELHDMPVRRIAAKDAVCFLWATVPLGADPYGVLDGWGFKFKTEWFWHKTGRMGTGYWTRGSVEKLLIGVRGNVKAWRSSLDNWIGEGSVPTEWALTDAEWRAAGCPPPGSALYSMAVAERGPAFDGVFESKPEGHSRKPAAARTMIEFLTPGARRVELFSTQPEIPNWTHYGLAIDPLHDFRKPEFWELVYAQPEPEAVSEPAHG